MIYRLIFSKEAKREWDKLDIKLQIQLGKKLKKRLENPIVLKDKLSDMDRCYKIKLKSSGYRLIYQVAQDQIIVCVIAIGKRDSYIYEIAKTRI